MTASLEPQTVSFHQRLGTLSMGVAFVYVTNKLFDYALYPYVIYLAGLWIGGIIMTALSAIVCLIILKLYDQTKRDWLGMETLRDFKDFNGKNRLARTFSWILRRGDPVSFIALSIYCDPFITTVWLRHKRFGRMTARDLRIFWGSVLVGNAFWAISCWLGINVFQWFWNWF